MSGSGGTDRAPSGVDDETPRPRRGPWRGWLAVAMCVLGLYLTVTTTARLIYRAEGVDPSTAEDCDDCDLTLVLDNLGWLALAVAAYFGLLLIGWRLRRRNDPGR